MFFSEKVQSERIHYNLQQALHLLNRVLMQASVLSDEKGIAVSKWMIKHCTVGQQNEAQVY